MPIDRGVGAVDSWFGIERADAWELRPGENGPETAAPDATTARHFVDELVQHAGHGNEAAGVKMKTLAMHLLNRPESRMSNRPESRMSNGSSVPTERAASRASVCTSPPGSPCRRFTSREDLESTAEPDVPCRFRTREGESSELRLRCIDQGWEKIRDIQNVRNVRDIRESLAGATQGTTTKTGPEDPAHESQVPKVTNKVNKCQLDQITKRRNYKRSLLNCFDAASQRKVLLCPCSTILGVCD